MINGLVNSSLRRLRDRWPSIGVFLQPSAISVLFGLLFGLLIFHLRGADVAAKLRQSFEPLFMQFCLPFIISDGAINAFPKKSFFRNLAPILLFAVLGTAIAILTTGILFWIASFLGLLGKVLSLHPGFYSHAGFHLRQSCLCYRHSSSTFGLQRPQAQWIVLSLSSSLYSIVYGESMLNDVIGYTSFQTLLDIHLLPIPPSILTLGPVLFWLAVSVLLGGCIGLTTALLCRYLSDTDPNADNDPHTDPESEGSLYSKDFAVMFLSPWIAYLAAEALDLSAILTIFFCGLTLGHFAST